ncbi:hypothetical protein K7X08_021917 [Anisodus acutangulus]|uniref:Uncharacterized protein n=1 Tax=Anisodus acutangulus TaxID=402998 RepID=A0A9Q1QV41_9SOLA|nr:hypothetical protein K7X08_021917 [Anisodus acutangulus]
MGDKAAVFGLVCEAAGLRVLEAAVVTLRYVAADLLVLGVLAGLMSKAGREIVGGVGDTGRLSSGGFDREIGGVWSATTPDIVGDGAAGVVFVGTGNYRLHIDWIRGDRGDSSRNV